MVKFFTPDSSWTCYATEFDGEDIFYGLVVGLEIELGYFSLSELEETRGPLGLPIERDLQFEPRALSELMEEHKRERQPRSLATSRETTDDLTMALIEFAQHLATWDRRLVEVSAIGDLARGSIAPTDAIQLACTFDPEPEDQDQGLFSIVNLLVRNDEEGLSETLGMAHRVELAFQFRGKLCLPNGKFVDRPEAQTVLWRRNHEESGRINF